MRVPSIRSWLALPALVVLPAFFLTLAAQHGKLLSIAGQNGSARVVQVGGRDYVEVEGLARLTKSNISFKGNEIILTLPGAASENPAPTASGANLSKEYATADIEAMARMQTWHDNLKNAIEHSVPLTDELLARYRAWSQEGVRLASVAATTAADKSAFTLLTNEFNNLGKLCDKYLEMTKAATYIAPNSLESDLLDQKIHNCAKFLGALSTTVPFVDDGSCQ
jgi:hypothetical protein